MYECLQGWIRSCDWSMLFLCVFRACCAWSNGKISSIDGDLADVGDKIYHLVIMYFWRAGILRASPIFGHSRPLCAIDATTGTTPHPTPLNGSPRQNGLLRVFWRGPPHIRDNIYLSPIHVYPDKSHITFYHGGRPCYFGHHHRTEAPSTTKAPKPSRVHSIVPW
jgi:hypothetical protein